MLVEEWALGLKGLKLEDDAATREEQQGDMRAPFMFEMSTLWTPRPSIIDGLLIKVYIRPSTN